MVNYSVIFQLDQQKTPSEDCCRPSGSTQTPDHNSNGTVEIFSKVWFVTTSGYLIMA